MNFSKILHERRFLGRYVLTGFMGFIFVSFFTNILSDKFLGHTRLAYAISLLTLYFIDYFINLKFVFQSEHAAQKFTRYGFYLVLSWLCGVAVFSLIIEFLKNSMFANALTLAFLFPFRYLISKRVLRGHNYF